MDMYKKLFSFVLFFSLLLVSVVQSQANGCGLEVINTEFILESDNEIIILIDVQSNNIEAEGIAYLINNIDLELFGTEIFWNPASFSVHSDDETFQIAISGTSTTLITLPDELILSGRIAFSFNEVPVLSEDNGVKNIEEDTIFVGTINSEFDEGNVAIVDTSITVLDSAILLVDTLLIEVDSLSVDLDTLILVDNSGVEFEDSLLLIYTPFSGDSVLIGYELVILEDLSNLCEVAYICELPAYNEEIIITEERISNDGNIDKDQKDLTAINFGSVFDDEIFEMEELSINVFPNPAVEYFYVDANITSEDSELIIYTINGNVVLQKDLNNANYSKINAKNLPDGLYFVLLKNSTGESQLTKLIIK